MMRTIDARDGKGKAQSHTSDLPRRKGPFLNPDSLIVWLALAALHLATSRLRYVQILPPSTQEEKARGHTAIARDF